MNGIWEEGPWVDRPHPERLMVPSAGVWALGWGLEDPPQGQLACRGRGCREEPMGSVSFPSEDDGIRKSSVRETAVL